MILSLGQDSSCEDIRDILGGPLVESTFLRRAKARQGTYAGDLFAALCDAIIRRSLDLKRDYATYIRLSAQHLRIPAQTFSLA